MPRAVDRHGHGQASVLGRRDDPQEAPPPTSQPPRHPIARRAPTTGGQNGRGRTDHQIKLSPLQLYSFISTAGRAPGKGESWEYGYPSLVWFSNASSSYFSSQHLPRSARRSARAFLLPCYLNYLMIYSATSFTHLARLKLANFDRFAEKISK